MITLKDFMEVVDYRITEGSDYTWSCFGPDARPYSLSAWNQEHDGWSFNIVFDTGDQEVYMVEACDYKHSRAYRLINPLWVDDYRDYARKHNADYEDTAWDGVDYVDLETEEDWLEKASAIVLGLDYDTRVSVPLELSDEDMLTYMKAAHERDMTFNQFVEEAIRQAVKDHERDPEAFKQRMNKHIEPHGY